MADDFRQILGIKFYVGGMSGLLSHTAQGGLVVVPAAPALVDLPTDAAYREAVEGSDFAITDSGFLVILWLMMKGERLQRISGLRYLRGLVELPDFRRPGATFWIMPFPDDDRENRRWLNDNGFSVTADDAYLAPFYPKGPLADEALLARIEAIKPRYIVINLGGGVQEKLGFYLRQKLSYRPAIICTGAAIAFLSGRQVGIPVWADRLMLGWLMRTFAAPSKFGPRYWKGLKLVGVLRRHGADSVTLHPA